MKVRSSHNSASHRLIYYGPRDYDDLGDGEYAHHGFSPNSAHGGWRTFTRNLLADMRDAQPTTDIINVDYFLIYGSGYIDDIQLLTRDGDASLTVPVGASYLTSDVESRPAVSAWHGSNFVQPLKRPFRLYQLSKFSVRASVNQASSRMGQMYVGLFDQDMKCVFWILLGDSWLSETRGYVYAAYYPESGGGYSQGSVDIYSSFDKTAAIWYDRCSSSIRSAIDGSMVTLAPAYNASRIVSYLVIRTHRYADASLLDMRVHDIDIAVNVRATLPWLPEPPQSEEPLPQIDDGTTSGRGEGVFQGYENGALKTPTAESLIGKLLQWWTGPWPRLHSKVDYTAPDGYSVKYHVSNDLLGCMINEENMEI